MPSLDQITGIRDRSRTRTRRRILDAAEQFVSHQGVSRLSMSEVGRLAGVGRGTVYRHFASRESLLGAMAAREARRFQNRLEESLKPGPDGEAPFETFVRHATWTVREHRMLRDLLENEPGFVLASLRENYVGIRESITKVVSPWLEESALDRLHDISKEQVIDSITRIMISHFLFPDPRPERAARELNGVFQLLVRPDTS